MNNQPFDVVIFDLDDTLVDTTQQCSYPALKTVFEWLIDSGANSTVEKLFAVRRQTFNKYSKEEFIHEVVDTFNLGEEIAKRAVELYTQETRKRLPSIPKTTLQVLSTLRESHTLFLVTYGDIERQKEKIKSLHIAQFFAQILFANRDTQQSKIEAFNKILNVERAKPERILSVGNRLDQDIAEAKDLGLKTCRILLGESAHLTPRNELEVPDYTISAIQEITDICRVQAPLPTYS